MYLLPPPSDLCPKFSYDLILYLRVHQKRSSSGFDDNNQHGSGPSFWRGLFAETHRESRMDAGIFLFCHVFYNSFTLWPLDDWLVFQGGHTRSHRDLGNIWERAGRVSGLKREPLGPEEILQAIFKVTFGQAARCVSTDLQVARQGLLGPWQRGCQQLPLAQTDTELLKFFCLSHKFLGQEGKGGLKLRGRKRSYNSAEIF